MMTETSYSDFHNGLMKQMAASLGIPRHILTSDRRAYLADPNNWSDGVAPTVENSEPSIDHEFGPTLTIGDDPPVPIQAALIKWTPPPGFAAAAQKMAKTSAADIKQRFLDAFGQSPTEDCPDCNGTGDYVGLNTREDCGTCGGSGKQKRQCAASSDLQSNALEKPGDQDRRRGLADAAPVNPRFRIDSKSIELCDTLTLKTHGVEFHLLCVHRAEASAFSDTGISLSFTADHLPGQLVDVCEGDKLAIHPDGTIEIFQADGKRHIHPA